MAYLHKTRVHAPIQKVLPASKALAVQPNLMRAGLYGKNAPDTNGKAIKAGSSVWK